MYCGPVVRPANTRSHMKTKLRELTPHKGMDSITWQPKCGSYSSIKHRQLEYKPHNKGCLTVKFNRWCWLSPPMSRSSLLQRRRPGRGRGSWSSSTRRRSSHRRSYRSRLTTRRLRPSVQSSPRLPLAGCSLLPSSSTTPAAVSNIQPHMLTALQWNQWQACSFTQLLSILLSKDQFM